MMAYAYYAERTRYALGWRGELITLLDEELLEFEHVALLQLTVPVLTSLACGSLRAGLASFDFARLRLAARRACLDFARLRLAVRRACLDFARLPRQFVNPR